MSYKYKFYLANHYGGCALISIVSDTYKKALKELYDILDTMGWPWDIPPNVRISSMDMEEITNKE
jgi:hypothetical protein